MLTCRDIDTDMIRSVSAASCAATNTGGNEAPHGGGAGAEGKAESGELRLPSLPTASAS